MDQAGPRRGEGRRRAIGGLVRWGPAVAGPAAATGLGQVVGHRTPVLAASLYLLAVVLAAATGGVWSGVASGVLSFVGLNYFFTPPVHTFRVDRADDVVALVAFLVVAVVIGTLLARAIAARQRAARRAEEAVRLREAATTLLGPGPLERRIADVCRTVVELFGLAACEVRAPLGDGELRASWPVAAAEPVPGRREDFPLSPEGAGVLTLVRPPASDDGAEPAAPPFDEADRRLIRAFAGQVALAVDRARSQRELEDTRTAAETERLRAAIFSSVTHDLRTPLASIKASVTAMLDSPSGETEEQRQELLRTILEESDRLNRLVANLLDLARLRAGALTPAVALTGLDELAGSVLARMAPSLRPYKVKTLLREVPDVQADPVQMDQVLTNLLENATRYSPPGSTITVSVAPWHSSVEVRVADQGPGIPEDDRERVFEPFFRRDAGRARGGSGLGLAIVRAIVEAHGGRAWIEGTPGGGTAVVFRVPAVAPALAPPAPAGRARSGHRDRA